MKYIIVAALDLETPNLESFAPLIHTGIGKVNAAIKLYEAIVKYQPDCVINYGTAGTTKHHSGLLRVKTFIQWDMDVRGLNVPRGVTPFEEQTLPLAKGIVLASGDSFVTDSQKQLEGLDINIDLIDMEGFALHKVCLHHAIDFHCYKYVTDKTDNNAPEDWAKHVDKGAFLFANELKQHYGVSSLSTNPY